MLLQKFRAALSPEGRTGSVLAGDLELGCGNYGYVESHFRAHLAAACHGPITMIGA
jgi:hypothetical protein